MPPKTQPRPQAARRSNRHANIDSQTPISPNEPAGDTADADITTDDTNEAGNVAGTSATAEVPPNAVSPPVTSRPPVQRLDSLRRRNVPTTSPTTSGSSSQAPPALKFQPKSFIRRSKEEREAFERAEEAKRQARLATGLPVQHARGGDGGTFSRGGFRGGVSGWRVERKGIGQATGPLSGPTSEQFKPVRGRGGGNAARSSAVSVRAALSLSRAATGGTTVVKDEPGMISTGQQRSSRKLREPKIKVEEGPTYVSSDSNDSEGPRINIEHINLISDESSEEESSKGKGKEREKSARKPGWSMKPIRLDRHEHIERNAGAAAAITSLTSAQLRQRVIERSQDDGSLFVSDNDEETVLIAKLKKVKSRDKDVEFIRDERKWKGVYRDEEDMEGSTKVKEEPRNEDVMDIDAISPVRPFVEDHTTDDAAIAAAPESSKKEQEVSPAIKRKKPLFRQFKPVLQTEEDRQEWERYEDDVTALGEELGLTGPTAVPVSTPATGGEDTEMKDDDEVEEDRRQGLVYLFQLPPILPYLVDAAKPDDPGEGPALVPETTPSSKPAASSSAKPSKTLIKIEDDPDPDIDKLSNALMTEDDDEFVGSVGKLTIFESGYIGISWGGIEYELSKSAGGELLQEVVVSDVGRVKKEEDARKEEGEGIVEKKGIAMGQIAGGFVITPNWERLFEG